MPIEELRHTDFLERVKRSAEYFADTLNAVFVKPIELSNKVETNNKQAARRLSNALPELKQTWVARCYLLRKIAERGFTVNVYLKEKQMSMLDALDATIETPKKKRRKETKKKKSQA